MRRPKTPDRYIRSVPDALAEQEFRAQGELLLALARLWLTDPRLRPDLARRAFEAGAALTFLSRAVHHEVMRRNADDKPTSTNPPPFASQ